MAYFATFRSPSRPRSNVRLRATARVAALTVAALAGCSDPAPAAPPTEAARTESDTPPPAAESPEGKLLVDRAIALERQGLLDEAAVAATEAVEAGGGRPAQLQSAKIAILRERYDDAEALLRPLVDADPNDADAHYNLGLVAHRRNRYNAARSGYLAALRAKADYPDARYNLAVLTWNREVKGEARHHVARFIEQWPTDPRTPQLVALVGAAEPPQPGKPAAAP